MTSTGRAGSRPFVLPRPAEWRLGRPAPWREQPGAVPASVSVDDLRAALARARQTLETPVGSTIAEWPGVPRSEHASENAVLLAVFEEDGEARLVLERRSEAVRRHRGEVSFPGGHLEAGETAVAAALREAHEEVGIQPGDVEVVGWLSPLRTYSGAAIIHPFVGVLPARPVLVVEPAEVAFAFDVPLAELLRDGAFREELWRRDAPSGPRGDGYVAILVFEAGGETIWGATARILAELCCVVAGTLPSRGREAPPD